jgi:hypothetical protein
MSVKDYSVEPALNVSISGINIAEGCAPSGINDAIRQLMADVKEESEAQAQAVGEAGEAVSELDAALRALVAQEVAKCLKLSGGGDVQGIISLLGTWGDFLGKIGGAVGDNGGSLRLTGGPYKATDSGACIHLYAKDHASMPGWVEIKPHNSSNTASIFIKPDGTFTHNGNNVLTSAGGTLTGVLNFGRNSVEAVNCVELQPPSGSGHGGFLDFHYGGSTTDYTSRIIESYSGHLEINAPNGVGLDGRRVLTGDDIFITGPAGTSFTLPAGGTWKYICVRNSGDTNVAQVGTVAGGTTVAFGHEIPRVLAIRIS